LSQQNTAPEIPSVEELVKARDRIRDFIHQTPVMTSMGINRVCSTNLYFKCENFQRTGSFKLRGALNAVMSLSGPDKAKGVVTHSSGNFAQAVALACRNQGIKATVVMPVTATRAKRIATESYGARIVECGPSLADREAVLQNVVEATGSIFIHPSNQLDVILGQGTAAMELIEEYKGLDFILAPVGGGGLIAGTALAAEYFSPHTTILGAEPFGADGGYRSLKAGRIIPSENPQTIADGLRTSLGDQNFPIIRKLVSEIIRVTEKEIVDSMRLIWERMKIIVEPSSAVALAAVRREPNRFSGKRVGILLSGGNVDLEHLPF
jgi:threonine dehydratase